MENYVTLKDFTEELFCMLTVCFEGNVSSTQEGAELLLPDGSRFIITVSKG